jgi:hypothetical protein
MSAVAKKLQIKPGHRVHVRGGPEGAIALPEGATRVRSLAAGLDAAVMFVTTGEEVAAIAAQRGKLPPIVWLAYPKKTSGVSSELTRDAGWDPLFDAGFIGIGSVAIDATWSAIRVRPGTDAERAKAAKLRAGMRRPGEKHTAKKPAPKVPADLARAVAKSAAAKKTLAALALSHLREYADWIESAKKPETRAARIAKAVEMLAAGVRDRNAKYRG